MRIGSPVFIQEIPGLTRYYQIYLLPCLIITCFAVHMFIKSAVSMGKFPDPPFFLRNCSSQLLFADDLLMVLLYIESFGFFFCC